MTQPLQPPPRALSIKPSWAWAILHLRKRIENRTWWTFWRGPLFLHASAQEKAREWAATDEFVRRMLKGQPRGGYVGLPNRDVLMSELAGRFFATCRLNGCVLPFGLSEDPAGDPSSLRTRWLATRGRVVPMSAAADLAIVEEHGTPHVSAGDPWLFPGHYGYVLHDAKPLRERVLWSGHQGLWTVPPAARRLVERAAA